LRPDEDLKNQLTTSEFLSAEDTIETSFSDQIPEDIKEAILVGENLPLGSDPYEGSFVYHFCRRKSRYEVLGSSILERVFLDILYRDKLREAQDTHVSGNIFPKRVVSTPQEITKEALDDLRDQVEASLLYPDFSIVTNYPVEWNEYGNSDNLLSTTEEEQKVQQRITIGLGIPESILTGEGLYSGTNVALETLNTQFMLFRERLQDFVENFIFKPVAIKKGFVRMDEWGSIVPIYPKLTFSRLAIKDSEEMFQRLFSMYQKGSVNAGVNLESLNLSEEDVKLKLKKDLFTVNDSTFNECLREVYSSSASDVIEQYDVTTKIAQELGLKKKHQEQAEEDAENEETMFGQESEGEMPERVSLDDLEAESKEKKPRKPQSKK
jgi:hypothetical protein